MINKTIYISGGISNNPDYEKQFNEAEIALKKEFKMVINPVSAGLTLEQKGKPTWSDYMRLCISLLVDSDYIYLLKNWDSSKGAQIEYGLARELGIKVLYQ